MSVWTLIKTGGWTMFPLFVCSVAVWGVIVERFWTLRNWREKNREFLLSFSNMWLRGDRDGARKLCERSNVELAELARELVSDQPISQRIISRVERRRLELSAELRRFLWV